MVAALTAGSLAWGGWAQAAPTAQAGNSGGPAGARTAAAPAGASGALQRDFAAAAGEFHVPAGVLMAVAYHQTLWDTHGGQPSTTGNYNVMGLTHVSTATLRTAQAGPETGQRGDGGPAAPPARSTAPGARSGTSTSTGSGSATSADGSTATSTAATTDPAAYRTLDAAAALTGAPASALRTDPRQSIRGGAALLAHYERQLTGSLPADPGSWYAAVARFSQSTDAQGASQYADRVYATLKAGVSRTTDTGQVVTLAADPAVVPRTSAVRSLGLGSATAEARGETSPRADGRATPAATPSPECPSGLTCNFVPAAYKQNSTTDKSKYGNYDLASRPSDGNKIQYIVIHDTEGSYSSALGIFQDSTSLATPHYLVRSSDGLVTQVVQTKNVAWHAGNYYINTHAIGIEHEGFAISGASWYDESLYESSAALVRYLSGRFGVPLDREHIIGHDDVPAPQVPQLADMHWDPGPYWNWSHYMDLLGATLGGGGAPWSAVRSPSTRRSPRRTSRRSPAAPPTRARPSRRASSTCAPRRPRPRRSSRTR